MPLNEIRKFVTSGIILDFVGRFFSKDGRSLNHGKALG